MLLGYDCKLLEKANGLITAREINQQPDLWAETYKIIKNNESKIKDFLRYLNNENIERIILTGAGTSAFAGECIAPYLSRKFKRTVEAIATTDIVTNPENYLYKNTPTLLISFARSGNSPESVAAVELAEKCIDKLHQLVLTCNPEGMLANKAKKDDKNLLIMMPEKSNDQGFAMTGSFSCMMLAVLLIFDIENIDKNQEQVRYIETIGRNILEEKLKTIKQIAELDFERVVFLGSSSLKGLAEEASLKVLELTRGKAAAVYNSSLGFRHGPKSIVNDKTVVISFLSNDKYTRQYEIDLLSEMSREEGGKILIAVSAGKDIEVEKLVNYMIVLDENNEEYKSDIYMAFNCLLTAQMFAFFKSLNLGVSPDNPSPDGRVNRVVKGVTIYKY